ncbi:hypothetical protein [Treponema sp. OMZ 805]|uniref:hypothetical protein n=1 Tax=Treponema sp. OMZ 805 TaxID=2726068 RepID=UPI003D94EF9F
MKRLCVSFVSILFAALCLVFTACNGMTAGNETGTVRIVIGSGDARAVDPANGLPRFDNTNTEITVTDAHSGTRLAQGTTSVTLHVAIGKIIKVEAAVKTAAGEWSGSVVHTVTAGNNDVAVRLSKTPKSVGKILFSVVADNPANPEITLKLGAKELLTNVNIGGNYILPVTARDGIGRIYVLYDKGGSRYLSRFDAEGKKDNGFETAITALLPPAGTLTSPAMITMTVDPKTNTIFLINRAKQAYALKETGHNTFTRSNAYNLTGSSISAVDDITVAAAYNNILFLTAASPSYGNKLIAYEAALSGSALTLTEKVVKTLPSLRPPSAVVNNNTACTGLFADQNRVYCLLKEQRLGHEKYALGQLVRYTYSGGALNDETKIGLNPKADNPDLGLAFDGNYFSNPIGFIGYDEEKIYIADDGLDIQYVNENWHIKSNKNRIAAFKRNTNAITFEDTAATWYEQKPEYKYPDTKILLWKNDGGNITYWTSADGTDPFSPDNTLFAASAFANPTDIFCYDQEGNLYILWKDTSNDYKVRRFELKNGVSYDGTAGVDSPVIGIGPRIPKYIAVDISDGQNCLYYGNDDGGWRVSKLIWGDNFSGLGTETNVNTNITGAMTALAANKDGVFVATKEQTVPSATYTLKVTKYKKDSPDTSDVTIVSSAIAEDSHTYPDSYNEYNEAIYDLRIVDGVLYAVTSKIEKGMKDNSGYQLDSFKNGSILYKIAETASFSGNAEKRAEKNPVPPEGMNPGTGYGFYRFIAVKPKKLVIASDSAWGKDGITASHVKANNNKVFEYDLDKNLLEEKDAGGIFSKQLQREPSSSGFNWE